MPRITSPATTPTSPTTSAGGTTWSGRASRSTPTASSSSASTTSAAASARPGRRRSTPRPASRGAPTFRWSPSRTGSTRRRGWPTGWASTQLAAVMGGSLGGMQALAWAIRYPQRMRHALVIAAAPNLSAQNIAFNEVARAGDPGRSRFPRRRLLRARTPCRDAASRRADDRAHHLPVRRADGGASSAASCATASTIRSRPNSRSSRTCATRATSSPSTTTRTPTCASPRRSTTSIPRRRPAAISPRRSRRRPASSWWCRFTTDWRFPPARSREIVKALVDSRRDVSYAEIDAPHGHDAFLLDNAAVPRASCAPTSTRIARAPKGSPRACSPPSATPRYGARDDARQVARHRGRGASDGDELAARRLRDDRALDRARCARARPGLRRRQPARATCTRRARRDGLRHRDRRRRRARQRAQRRQRLQSDLESGLAGFDDAVVRLRHPVADAAGDAPHRDIVAEMLRVGREAIVTFPNFGHWSHRWQILRGRMPVSETLPYQWFDTPNIHLCTVADFDAFLRRTRLPRGRPHRARRRAAMTASRPTCSASSRSTAFAAPDADRRHRVAPRQVGIEQGREAAPGEVGHESRAATGLIGAAAIMHSTITASSASWSTSAAPRRCTAEEQPRERGIRARAGAPTASTRCSRRGRSSRQHEPAGEGDGDVERRPHRREHRVGADSTKACRDGDTTRRDGSASRTTRRQPRPARKAIRATMFHGSWGERGGDAAQVPRLVRHSKGQATPTAAIARAFCCQVSAGRDVAPLPQSLPVSMTGAIPGGRRCSTGGC